MPTKSPLPATWKVPQVFRSRLGEKAGRQRAMFADGHLLLVLHEPPSPDETHRNARLFWRAPDGTWQSNVLGPGIKALRRHLADYAEAVEQLDEAEERAQRADDYFDILRQIAPLRRAARNTHGALQEARRLVPEDRDILLCRDQAYSIERAAELLGGDTQSGLDCAMARRAEEQAQHSYQMAQAGLRLNLMAATFLPVATIASVFGMNLVHGFEKAFAPWPFWLALLTGICLGMLLRSSMTDQPLPRLPDVGREPGRL